MSDEFEASTLMGLRDGPWEISEAEKNAITWAFARIKELEEIIDAGIENLTTEEQRRLWIYEMTDEHAEVLFQYESRIAELENSIRNLLSTIEKLEA